MENCHRPGSSPLTRGKLSGLTTPTQAPRLIPAHAGKTRRWLTRPRARRAHPRSRGENADSIRSIRPVGGSSPLTRGKLKRTSGSTEGSGLIPAHAGKTHAWCRAHLSTAAHPRSRGENISDHVGIVEANGSSPLTRGKHNGCADRRAHARLIPAHAGKTFLTTWESSKRTAHPRSRGENFSSTN